MKGFTLLEMMVGLIILAVGIIGFSGMTIMMAQGNRQARAVDDLATLSQTIIEDLSGVPFANLGMDTTLPAPNGLVNAAVRIEGPLNRNGQPLGTGAGPYTYYRSVVICPSGDTTAAGGTPTYCGGSMSGQNRPLELACNTLTLTANEKMVRVLVSYTDRNGKCHWKAVDSLAFNW